jgi:hypothetical protein
MLCGKNPKEIKPGMFTLCEAGEGGMDIAMPMLG